MAKQFIFMGRSGKNDILARNGVADNLFARCNKPIIERGDIVFPDAGNALLCLNVEGRHEVGRMFEMVKPCAAEV